MTETILTNKKHGMLVLLLTLALYVLAVIGTILFAMEAMVAPMVVCIVYLCLGWIFFLGLKVLAPQEALVLTLFGRYIGTLKGEGFYFVNPFCVAVNPAAKTQMNQSPDIESAKGAASWRPWQGSSTGLPKGGREQEDLPEEQDPQQRPPEDQRLPGQPHRDRHRRHLAGGGHGEGGFRRGQLQGVPLPPVRRRPAEHRPPLPLRHRPRGRRPAETSTPDEESLRGSSEVVAARIREELQSKVQEAGLEILQVRITHLAYASEIAATMLQRRQASAIIDARKMIVEGLWAPWRWPWNGSTRAVW